MRAALGATRGALIRKQLVEAFVLAAIGGGLGVLVASRRRARADPRGPVHDSTAQRRRARSARAAGRGWRHVFAALIFGIVPAFRYTRSATMGALRHGGRGATVDKARHRGRQVARRRADGA